MRSFPKRVIIEITNRCNLDCDFCSRHNFDMVLGNMSAELFYRIIDECAQYIPIQIALFFRGEPLLIKELPLFIQYAKTRGIEDIQLSTNALLLDDRLIEEILRAEPSFINFSLNTNEEQFYGMKHINEDFEKLKQNVLNFIKRRDEMQNSKIEIQISSVDTVAHRAKQEEFIHYWVNYADKVRIYTEHSTNGFFGSIVDKQERPSLKRLPCKKVSEEFVIYFDGTVAICNHDWNNLMNLGSVSESTIEDIWNSEKYEVIRLNHQKNDFTDGFICKNCDHWIMGYDEAKPISKVFYKNKKQPIMKQEQG